MQLNKISQGEPVMTVSSHFAALLLAVILTWPALSQAQASETPDDPPSASGAQGKPRVFVADSRGNFDKSTIHPQNPEVVKTLSERCSAVDVTAKQENADFVIVVDHDRSMHLGRKRNKVALFDRDGNLIFSSSTRALGNAVKDSCQAIVHASKEKKDTASASILATSAGGQR